MEYICTRGGSCARASQAILRGIAANGGLYMPGDLPRFSRAEIESFAALPYPERAARTLCALLNDYSAEEVRALTQAAYASFDTPEVAPVTALDGDTHILELFHGPTLAFKDMALQVLPRLMTAAARKQGEEREILILTATSGDTGKAALRGFQDVPGTSVAVFYPLGGVSRMQEMQMLTQEGKNVRVIGVHGNFDDAQNGVKRLFTNPDFIARMNARGRTLSSANSINLGRLVPQVAYYLSACAQLLRRGQISWDQGLVVCVPTGNFGDILAAWYARRMGAPLSRLICASNANNVLTSFFNTGAYDRNRPLVKTISPSMDILISSNLERYLLELAGMDCALVSRWMDDLRASGRFEIGEERLRAMREYFYAGSADDSATRAEIARVFRDYRYTLDPHTAVASRVLRDYRAETGDASPALIVSTASPYKFAPDVLRALGEDAGDALQALKRLEALCGAPLPASLAQLLGMPVLHTQTCAPQTMDEALFSAF